MVTKTALACIAKNEDMYIDEWIEYHLKIGFDKIFIFCDYWKHTFKKDHRVKIMNV